MERTINRNLVKAAVMRQIFCPSCDNILDMRRAVLVTGHGSAACVCGKCWDIAKSHVTKKLEGTEVLDGRVLWGRAKR